MGLFKSERRVCEIEVKKLIPLFPSNKVNGNLVLSILELGIVNWLDVIQTPERRRTYVYHGNARLMAARYIIEHPEIFRKEVIEKFKVLPCMCIGTGTKKHILAWAKALTAKWQKR